ncbi:MAG: terpene cyclase [Candidatus Nealsonbacteria bacterium]|nr:terpene cyclase [Candidatus Nealsonbacteria bacterium]
MILNWKQILLIFLLAATASVSVWYLAKEEIPDRTFLSLGEGRLDENPSVQEPEEIQESGKDSGLSSADKFRNQCIFFVRSFIDSYYQEKPVEYPESFNVDGNWNLSLSLYHQGKEERTTNGSGPTVYLAIEDALKDILEGVGREKIEEGRFLVSFYSPEESFDFIEHQGKGIELVNDMVPVREMDKELIIEELDKGKEFLFGMMNPEKKGFYKRYDAVYDSFQERLHTVYSASIAYTLMKIDEFSEDERVERMIPAWGNFLLSMQNLTGEHRGGFHYSYYLDEREKELRFVVGTAALNIFTLLDMYERTGEENYLEASQLAGDWLITMQKENGMVKPYTEYDNGIWVQGEKESLLYNGQVLASLSRLYKETGDKSYYDAAEKIASRFKEKVSTKGCFLGDDYRSPNPISSAWVVMSLLDFYKADPQPDVRRIILDCSSELVRRQMRETNDPLYKGRWNLAFSSSGNGWLAEVMMEMYHFCLQEEAEGCEKYKEATIQVIRWLSQHTYTEENSFMLENPERAEGGLFWDFDDKYVRTDSVCHGLNAYAGIVGDLGEGILVSIPEPDLSERDFWKTSQN